MLYIKKRGQIWHIEGTVTYAGQKKTVRKTTGHTLRREAEEECRAIEQRVINEMKGGDNLTPFNEVADDWFETTKQGATCEVNTRRLKLEWGKIPISKLDTAAWNRTGTTGPTVGETLVRAGHKLRRADKNRIQGKIQIHEYLKVQQSGRPRIQIFNTCPNLIRELQSIPLDRTNPEDVDTHAQDHAYDALRYLIMSRPKVNDPLAQMRHMRMEQAYTPVDAEFGY